MLISLALTKNLVLTKNYFRNHKKFCQIKCTLNESSCKELKETLEKLHKNNKIKCFVTIILNSFS